MTTSKSEVISRAAIIAGVFAIAASMAITVIRARQSSPSDNAESDDSGAIEGEHQYGLFAENA